MRMLNYHFPVGLQIEDLVGVVVDRMAETMDKTTWSDDEIQTMLQFFIQDNTAARVLDSKRQRNKDLYDRVENELKDRGFSKTSEQCRRKFKSLKSTYIDQKTKATTSGEFKLHNN